MKTPLENWADVAPLVAAGALVVVNHSAGKDSQAMYLRVRAVVPDDQIVVVHAPLPGADWPDLDAHLVATLARCHKVIYAEATKTFEEMVLHQGYWPTPKYRQCTSDLKRGPIEREIKGILKRNPRFSGVVISAQGMRAQESSARKKLDCFTYSKGNSKAGRKWWNWLPIHKMLIEEVFATIADAGQKPHWAYSKGMSRLSCRFCIMANKADLTTAATENPAMYATYCAMEYRLGDGVNPQTFTMPSKSKGPLTLSDITGVQPDPVIFAAELARLLEIKTPIKTKSTGQDATFGGKLRTLENFQGHEVLYVQKSRTEQWVLSRTEYPQASKLIAVNGRTYFKTLAELHTAINVPVVSSPPTLNPRYTRIG